MKQKNFLKIIFLLFFLTLSSLFGQVTGDLAFVAFNASGDKDFAVVALADIPATTTIYFTDRSSVEPGDFGGGEGSLTWITPASIITSGTIIIFTDVDNGTNPKFGASIGTLSRSGSFNLSTSKDNIFAYTGTDINTVTTFIAGIQIGNDATKTGDLTGTGLIVGTTHIVIDVTAANNAGYFSGVRSSQATYPLYLTTAGTSKIGDKTNWTTVGSSANGEALLNFPTEAFTLSGAATTWTGGFNTVWNLAGNWDNGVPTSNSNVTIPDVANDPIISDPSIAGNVTLNSGASLTLNNTLTNKGFTTLNSAASLIASSGTITGNITYKRNLGTTNWYLISSPVIGETIVNFVTKNSTALGSGVGVAQNNALAPYDNTQALSADRWSYYTVGQTDGASGDDTADSFIAGQGFTTKLTATADILFTGTMNTADVTKAITIGAGNAFNAIGNPYTSFINSGTGGFLPDNTARLTTETLWIWDQGSDTYITKVTADEFKIAPGQGFFVECGSAGNVTFEEADQSHEAADTFLRSTNSRPEIHLFMSDGTTSKFAKIYYINGTTTGFDNGYDGELFGGVSNPFAVYTHLVSDSQGKDYQIQSLPDSNYENMVIPVGVNATSGTEITFRADVLNMPVGMDVYLENRTANTFTKLTDNGTYTLTLNADSNSIGQFYLRTSSSALGVENVLLDNVSIYKTSNSMLRVAGLQQGNASLKVVNLLGKQVLTKSFTTNGVSDISLSKLATGIYIVQLQTENGKLNKKIIIE